MLCTGQYNGKPNNYSMSDPVEPEESRICDESALIVDEFNKILKSQVRSMILNVILIVEEDCDLKDFPREVHHHANVEIQSENMVVNMKDPVWGSLDLYQDSLTKKLAEVSSLSDDRIFSILGDLAGGVKRLHDMGKPHGKIIPDNVFLSFDERKHPFLQGSESNNNHCDLQNDIKDLGKLFYFVLTNGLDYLSPITQPIVNHLKCDEKHTAWDLLSKMINGLPGGEEITLQDVLDHPLFWSNQRKEIFITDIYDSVSHRKDSLKPLEQKAKEVFKSEWKEALRMTPEEKNRLQDDDDVNDDEIDMDKIFWLAGGKKTKRKTNLFWTIYFCDGERLKKVDNIGESKWNALVAKTRTNQNKNETSTLSKQKVQQIIDQTAELKGKKCEIFGPIILVMKEENGGYDGKSIYDLLRFIRNKKAHFAEADVLVENCFKGAGGFWKFFISRYPTLLVFIYNNLESFPRYHPRD